MKGKVLVTGGAGFIGSHIVDEFIKEGLQVVVIDNDSSNDRQKIRNVAAFPGNWRGWSDSNRGWSLCRYSSEDR